MAAPKAKSWVGALGSVPSANRGGGARSSRALASEDSLTGIKLRDPCHHRQGVLMAERYWPQIIEDTTTHGVSYRDWDGTRHAPRLGDGTSRTRSLPSCTEQERKGTPSDVLLISECQNDVVSPWPSLHDPRRGSGALKHKKASMSTYFKMKSTTAKFGNTFIPQ